MARATGDVLHGKWHELKGKARQQWDKLTDDDLERINGKREELSGTLQKRYGYDKAKADMEAHNWLRDYGTGNISPVTQSVDIFENKAMKVNEQSQVQRTNTAIITLIESERSEIVADYYARLTPSTLASTITPYLNAIANIQHIADEVQNRRPREVFITSIQQNSPISVSLEGASEAIQVVKDTIVPWRRKHAETMAHLSEREKQAEIESKSAEVLEKRARAAKNRAEAERLTAEATKQRAEAEKLALENEKLRLELQRAKIQLALDILNQIAPTLTEAERISYLIRLLPPIDVLIFSSLEIATGK